jgi:hypothetical protein
MYGGTVIPVNEKEISGPHNVGDFEKKSQTFKGNGHCWRRTLSTIYGILKVEKIGDGHPGT